MTKQEFIARWSVWWSLNPNKEKLTESFEKELNSLTGSTEILINALEKISDWNVEDEYHLGDPNSYAIQTLEEYKKSIK